jgi:hypothetical protein
LPLFANTNKEVSPSSMEDYKTTPVTCFIYRHSHIFKPLSLIKKAAAKTRVRPLFLQPPR